MREGDVVRKDQALVVIESMKMETVIRRPGDGMVVRRVVHGEGVSYFLPFLVVSTYALWILTVNFRTYVKQARH